MVNRSTNGIEVTDHAILRYLERTNSRYSKANRILAVVAFGTEVKPKNKLAKLLRHKCKNAKYYKRGTMIAVVADNKVVTVYQYKPEDWAE